MFSQVDMLNASREAVDSLDLQNDRNIWRERTALAGYVAEVVVDLNLIPHARDSESVAGTPTSSVGCELLGPLFDLLIQWLVI